VHRRRNGRGGTVRGRPVATPDLSQDALRYAVDWTQRWILAWNALRERGNNFLEHERAGLPPLLHFEYETLIDGRSFERPVNYRLLRIMPPAGAAIDPAKRPYVIIDPRAGHGPGIGGFKDDSQVGVALRGGHPVYFVAFYPVPEPGQTLLDVCEAEAKFVRHVRELHPASPKPVVIGNCQGGWAAMMLAASHPEDTGPIVIIGAPLSYWSGAWRDGPGDNPMRYAGGLLGGTWLASLASDLGAGKFDGANLARNFEALDPAQHLWAKYYELFSNVDTEAQRFLDFERWWGGFFQLQRQEIEWITQNLFVGNRLVANEVRSASGRAFDLREIRSPIVLFASLGDNITPPQQAFNWVADLYGSTEEIKARGQVIVGLLHQSIGHLGIFVSGKVARKEHTQLVSVLQSIEALPPGLYAMDIAERAKDGGPEYEVSFIEYRLEDALEQLNRHRRADERPFEAVAAVSDFNQAFYNAFARPLVQAWASEPVANLMRQLHPLRFSRWAISDLNPWLWWLAPAASAVAANRQPLEADAPLRRAENSFAQLIGAAFDSWRDYRDAWSEAAFFQLYGNPLATGLVPEKTAAGALGRRWRDTNPRDLPFVRELLEHMAEGGYAEAVGRLGALLRTAGEPLPLSRVEARHRFAVENLELLPDIELADLRRIEGSQEIIVRLATERAVQTLPALVVDPADRERLITLIERAIAFHSSGERWLGAEQRSLLARIRATLLTPEQRLRDVHAQDRRIKRRA
jgi:pimeloyl-ACP methyl ester carboxylesterase